MERVRFEDPEPVQTVVEEPAANSFAFSHQNQFSLPNYYGDLPGNNNPLPIEMKGED